MGVAAAATADADIGSSAGAGVDAADEEHVLVRAPWYGSPPRSTRQREPRHVLRGIEHQNRIDADNASSKDRP